MAVGQSISDGEVHITTPMVITAIRTGTGANGIYTVSNGNGTITSETMTAAGTLGSSGSPVNIYAGESYYNTVAPAARPRDGGSVTAKTQTASAT